MRSLVLILLLLAPANVVWAIEAPAGQAHIGLQDVLRGRFVEEHQVKGLQGPMISSGHFILAPAHGLIWGIEKPFPTSMIVTRDGLAQDVGGIAIKLPAKNLRHLYEMVGGALEGDWSGLESEFTLTRSENAGRWQMLLTPIPNGKHSLSYARITVSGGRFVENIAMMKADGSADTLSFTDEALSSAPMAAQEIAVFKEAKK